MNHAMTAIGGPQLTENGWAITFQNSWGNGVDPLNKLTGLPVSASPYVDPNKAYLFADPQFIGKSYVLEDETWFAHRPKWPEDMSDIEKAMLESEGIRPPGDYLLEFFAHETIGACIGNTSALAKVDFI